VRGALLGVLAGLAVVFTIAALLDPYRGDGSARQMETHTQMGLPPCSFKTMSGLPCPSCGMTTSFALLFRWPPDVWNSLRANAVGTLLASFCIGAALWGLASVVRNRPVWIVSIERALIRTISIFLILLLTRWVIVVGLCWITGVRG
jgi:hypothetical protein